MSFDQIRYSHEREHRQYATAIHYEVSTRGLIGHAIVDGEMVSILFPMTIVDARWAIKDEDYPLKPNQPFIFNGTQGVISDGERDHQLRLVKTVGPAEHRPVPIYTAEELAGEKRKARMRSYDPPIRVGGYQLCPLS